MSSELLGSAVSVLDGNLASAWDALRGRSGSFDPALPTVFSTAYGVWSTKDVFGTGGNVIELVSSGASPSTRNFTATELTDGTYASWVSSAPTVKTLYDQVGSLNLAQGFAGIAPLYVSSSNTLQFNKDGFMGNPRKMSSSSNSQVNTDFGGNTVTPHSQVTFAVNVKATTGSQGTGSQVIAGVRDNAPTQPINQRAKYIIQNDATSIVGLRQRDQAYTIFDTFHDSAIGSSFENYIGSMQRNKQAEGATQTLLDMFVDGTQEIDANTTTLSTECQVFIFELGGSRFETNIFAAFDEALDATSVANLNTEMDAL